MKIRTPEEILIEKGFFVMTHKEGSEHVKRAFIEPVIAAMKAYADQLEISDEEIEKAVDDKISSIHFSDKTLKEMVRGWMKHSAKWYKAELKRRRNEDV